MVYVVVCVGEKDCVPDVAFVPLHPPDAVQEVAFVELHVSVEDWPDVIGEGEEERETVGVCVVTDEDGEGEGEGEGEDGEVPLGCSPISPCISDSVSARL